MAEEKNQEQNLSQLLQIRRDKLKELQEGGRDPFQITKYEVTHDSAAIKADFDAMEGSQVSLAGRLMARCPSATCRTSRAASSSMPAGTRWMGRSTTASRSWISATSWE